MAHRKPTRPQPTTTVVTAITTRMTASVTISAPYCDQRLSPASMPSSVACRQKPASPTDSRITDSNRDSTNTCGDHRMAVAAITAAAITPTAAATRIGWVTGPPLSGSTWAAMRISRVVCCSSPFAAPVTRPKAPQNTPNTEKPAGSSSRAARYSTA